MSVDLTKYSHLTTGAVADFALRSKLCSKDGFGNRNLDIAKMTLIQKLISVGLIGICYKQF